MSTAFSRASRPTHLLWLAAISTAVAVEGSRAVEPAFNGSGLTSVKVDGVEVLKVGRPQVRGVVFEETKPDDKGFRKYTFDTLADAGKAAFDADKRTHTETYTWGSVAVTYTPGKECLDLVTTITNTSARTLADFDLYLGTFEFPAEPVGWKGGKGQTVCTLDTLGLVKVEASKVRLVAACATFNPPVRFGFGAASEKGKQVYPLVLRGGVTATEPGAYWVEPHGRPRVPAGKSLTLTLTLRRVPTEGQASEVLADVVKAYQKEYGSGVVWKDRGPIGMIVHASSAAQHHSKTNPRGWLNDPKLDVTTAAGRAVFRERMLAAAEQGVKVIKDTGGQGMIFWDVEGEENPHPVSYIGDPTMLAKLAPEMDEIADDYFKVYAAAGLRTGVTLRPTQVYFDEKKKGWAHGTGSDGSPDRGDYYPKLRPRDVPWWKFYPVVERLNDRVAYAKKRWGCTLFYIDTNGLTRQNGPDQKFTWHLLEAEVLRRVRQDHPDVLLIPELHKDGQTSHTAYWGTAAPYMELDLKGYRTPDAVRDLFPDAFSVVNVTDGDFEANRTALKTGVGRGDILLFRGWFADKRNAAVKDLYAEANKGKK